MLLSFTLAQFDYFCDIVSPVLFFVVLPIVIVWLVLRHRRYELDKRTDVMLKALECGVPMDSAIFQQVFPSSGSTPKYYKKRIQRSLIASIIFFAVGLLPFIFGLIVVLSENPDELSEDETKAFAIVILILMLGAFLLIIGTVLLVIYFINKKNYEKELAKLDEGKDLK